MKMDSRDNALPLGPVVYWVMLAIFLSVLGLCYVRMKHTLKVDGDRCRDLEHEVADLDEKLKVAANEMMRLTSRPALERRRQEGFIRMVQVQNASLVRLVPTAAQEASLAVPATKEAMP